MSIKSENKEEKLCRHEIYDDWNPPHDPWCYTKKRRKIDMDILDCPGCGQPVATIKDNTQSKGYVFILHYAPYPYVCSGIGENVNRIWREAYDTQIKKESE